jgi:hypothetical protein
VPIWAATLLGVGVGGAIAFLNSLYVEMLRRRKAEQQERRSTLATYLGRLYVVVGFMIQWPQEISPSALERVRRSTLERSARTRTRVWIRGQQHLREVFGNDVYKPLYRFVEASAFLQILPLDEDVHAAVGEANSYVEKLAHDRSDEVVDEWRRVRKRLLEAIAASGDGGVLEAAEAARAALPPE